MLASSAQLHESRPGGDPRVAFNSDLDPAALRTYSAVLLEPAQVYHGADHQFAQLAESDRRALAQHAQAAFAKAFSTRKRLAVGADGDVLRLRVTITGAQKSVPVLSAATKVTPVGLALTGMRSATDREAAFNGSVIYAVELFDSVSGRLVYAYVARQYPNALNIPASLRPLDAAKAGIDRGAAAAANSLSVLMRQGSRP